MIVFPLFVLLVPLLLKQGLFLPAMSLLLCIESATKVCSVSLALNGQMIALEESPEANVHASMLHVLIGSLLKKSGITPKRLTAIAVSKGPGSYTGLRVGVSAAKGFSYALNIPLIAVNTLEALALAAHHKYADVSCFIPMIDARRAEVYCGVFGAEGSQLEPIRAEILTGDSFDAIRYSKSPVVFCGDAAIKAKNLINPAQQFIFDEELYCSASSMITPANRAFNEKRFENLAYFEPFYLKDFVGTTPRKTTP